MLVPLLPTSVTVLILGAVLVAAGLITSWRLRSIGPSGVALVAVVVALTVGVPVALGDRCDAESAYYCAEVEVDEERPSGRILVLDKVAHSYVDLDDPRYLGFPYSRWMAPALERLPAAGGRFDAVFVGGGGFTLPRYLSAVRPGRGRACSRSTASLSTWRAIAWACRRLTSARCACAWATRG